MHHLSQIHHKRPSPVVKTVAGSVTRYKTVDRFALDDLFPWRWSPMINACRCVTESESPARERSDGLQVAWQIDSKLVNFKPVTLSGDGNILLSVSDRSVLHLRSTLEPYSQADVTWCFADNSNQSTRMGKISALALDHKGQTAAIAYWFRCRRRSRYLLTIKIFSYQSSVTLLSSRTIRDAKSLESFSISPGGLSWAVTYTLRSSDLKHIEVAQIRIIDETPRYALVGSSSPKADLRLPPNTVVRCSDSDVIIITSKPLTVRKYSLHELVDREGRSLKVPIDGIDFTLMDQCSIHYPIASELSGFPTVIPYIEYSSKTGYLVIAFPETIFVWDTIRRVEVIQYSPDGSVPFHSNAHRDIYTMCTVEDKIVISCGEYLHIMGRSIPSRSRSIRIPLLLEGVTHFLRARGRSLQITVVNQTNITCYTLPGNVMDLVSKNGTTTDLSDLLTPTEEYVGAGGYGEVYKAVWKCHTLDPPFPVAVKIFRTLDMGNPRSTRLYNREIEVWKRLKHQNIVPFLGIISSSGMWGCSLRPKLPALVSVWMGNGTISEFLRRHPDHDRLKLIHGVGTGLAFLHDQSPAIIHGDLKAANVLVDDSGNPRITDFGISRLLEDTSLWNTSRSMVSCSVRWMGPELIKGESARATKASDVYAFGMTCYEIITGEIPFAKEYKRCVQVSFNVVHYGARPEHPESKDCTDGLWSVLTACWMSDTSLRPSMPVIMSRLTELSSEQ